MKDEIHPSAFRLPPSAWAMLVQRSDLIGGDEPLSSCRADDDPMEDVFRRRGHDMVDRSDELATRRVDGHIAFEHLVGDRPAFVHGWSLAKHASQAFAPGRIWTTTT